MTVGGETAHRGGFGAGTFNYAATAIRASRHLHRTQDRRLPARRRKRHALGAHAILRLAVRAVHRRADARHGLSPDGRAGARELGSDARHVGRRQLRVVAAGRGQPLGSDPWRRRQSDRRAQRPAARSRLRASRELACRLVRSRVGDLFVQHATRRAGQSRRTGRSERRDRASTGTHDGPWRAGQRVASDLVAAEPARRRRRVLRGARLRLVRRESVDWGARDQPSACSRRRHLQTGRDFRADRFRREQPPGADRSRARRLQSIHGKAVGCACRERPSVVAG